MKDYEFFLRTDTLLGYSPLVPKFGGVCVKRLFRAAFVIVVAALMAIAPVMHAWALGSLAPAAGEPANAASGEPTPCVELGDGGAGSHHTDHHDHGKFTCPLCALCTSCGIAFLPVAFVVGIDGAFIPTATAARPLVPISNSLLARPPRP